MSSAPEQRRVVVAGDAYFGEVGELVETDCDGLGVHDKIRFDDGNELLYRPEETEPVIDYQI